MISPTEPRENGGFASELKFLVPRALGEPICDWARTHLAPDPNASNPAGAYRVTSIYFDTPAFDVFHRRGSFGRSKFRIRRYGFEETAFLERKLKRQGRVSKRRSAVSLGEVERLIPAEAEKDWAGYWFHRRLLARRLRAVCRISYQRMARVAQTSAGPARLTLDEDIRGLAADDLSFKGEDGGAAVLREHLILEVKYRREVPLLFKLLAEEFGLNPAPVSKYRLTMAALKCGPVHAEVRDRDWSACLSF